MGEIKEWKVATIGKAIKILFAEHNTLFDDLIKNLENNEDLRELMFNIIMNGEEKTYNIYNKTSSIGEMFGYFSERDHKVSISSVIFKEILYNYFSSEVEEKGCKNKKT